MILIGTYIAFDDLGTKITVVKDIQYGGQLHLDKLGNVQFNSGMAGQTLNGKEFTKMLIRYWKFI